MGCHNINKQGLIIEGQLLNDPKSSGILRLEFEDGAIVEGDYYWKRKIFPDGSYFMGQVNNVGRLHGVGKMMDSSGLVKEGYWQHGELIE